MPHGDCARCFLVERCLYPRLFETSANHEHGLLAKNKDAPRPFIFLPPLPDLDSDFMRARDGLMRWRLPVQAGETVVFGLSLLGAAIQDLPYVIHAIDSMARHGLGAERAAFGLQAVAVLDAHGNREIIYSQGGARLRPHAPSTLGTLTRARLEQLGVSTRDKVSISFITPARIRSKGEVAETIDFPKLISILSLRLSLLVETHGQKRIDYDYQGMIESAHHVRTEASGLRLMALDRFSNRIRRKLELDGVMGNVSYVGSSIRDLMPLIVAGEFLNVGSGTAFGMGRYVIVE